ncbi:MAG: hypothetical protein P8M61_10770 [Crocinitomicaceae bacterium]|nr:hypothetical protein [Crocinitomicaceae bacterium]
MNSNNTIGIIGLGWLGESLADFLKTEQNQVWGTVTSAEKAARISQKGISTLRWNSQDSFSEELKKYFSQTDILILNLPPSVFKTITYAEGLSAFIPYLNKKAKVIFTSSTGVYPDHLENVREDYVFQTEDSNKLIEAEETLQQQLGDRLSILRLAGLIGEDRNPVRYLAKKEVNDDPNKGVNLIHRKDILRVVDLLISRNVFGEIFNVCHPSHPTREAYYTQKALDYNLGKIKFGPPTKNQLNKVVNCDKLQKELNYNQFELM